MDSFIEGTRTAHCATSSSSPVAIPFGYWRFAAFARDGAGSNSLTDLACTRKPSAVILFGLLMALDEVHDFIASQAVGTSHRHRLGIVQ